MVSSLAAKSISGPLTGGTVTAHSTDAGFMGLESCQVGVKISFLMVYLMFPALGELTYQW